MNLRMKHKTPDLAGGTTGVAHKSSLITSHLNFMSVRPGAKQLLNLNETSFQFIAGCRFTLSWCSCNPRSSHNYDAALGLLQRNAQELEHLKDILEKCGVSEDDDSSRVLVLVFKLVCGVGAVGQCHFDTSSESTEQSLDSYFINGGHESYGK